MKKLSALTTLEKAMAIIIALGACWTILSGVYNHFEKTVVARAERAIIIKEASIARKAIINTQLEYEAAQYRADKQDRVDRLERENQRIRRELANPNIAEWDEEQAILDRAENNDKIECVREDKC